MLSPIPYLMGMGFSIQELGKIIYLLFIRSPIVIIGKDNEKNKQSVKAIVKLMPHRRVYYFGIDFFEENEVKEIINNEKLDYNVPRAIFCAFPNNSKIALKKFNNFYSWVLGITDQDSIHDNYIDIEHFSVVNVDSLKITTPNRITSRLSFETQIIKNSIKKSEEVIVRLKRVLEKKISKNKNSSPFLKELLDFDEEKATIINDFYNEAIMEFMHAAKRVLAIFLRIKALKDLGIYNLTISEANIKEAINYRFVSLQRILDFIYHEWGEDFRNILTNNKSDVLGDWIDSLWG